uniref:Tyrosine-protein kinase n=1 Tax=Xenopus tropicalis TaxID=8364 RepID=A0A6I8PXX3_XENTR
MESFLREHLPCFNCLWDRIWPPKRSGVYVSTVDLVIQDNYPSRTDRVTALYSFNARSTHELTIEQGEELCMISDEGEYILARKLTGNMESGLVPASYVAQSSLPGGHYTIQEPWYMEVASRNDAERLLFSSPNAHGSFLVRPSDSTPGHYSLSVRNEDKVSHFCISVSPGGQFYIQNEKVFASIEKLVNFYKTNWKLIKSPLLKPCVWVAYQRDQWERPRSEFKLVRQLGAGNFGEVWEGLWNNKDKVAIKTFKQDNINESDFKKEVNALKTLCHKNLIQLYAVCSVGEPVYIVTELMSKGSLLQFLRGTEGRHLTAGSFMHIISQVAEGMAYLENKHVLHITLAARNVLVGEELLCKIADFGLARILKNDFYLIDEVTTVPVRWTAPEVLTRYRYTAKSDVWSFGIVMYEVFMLGRTPYLGMNNQEVKDKVTSGYRLPKPDDCSPDIYNLMLECWQKNPNRRPSFFELVEKLTAIQCSLQ